MRRAVLASLALVVALGCDDDGEPTDAGTDAGGVDAGPVMDWPFAEVPLSDEPEPGVTRELVMVDGVEVPRSRADGFDYDGASNSIIFRGSTYRPAIGSEVVVSYRTWAAGVQ